MIAEIEREIDIDDVHIPDHTVQIADTKSIMIKKNDRSILIVMVDGTDTETDLNKRKANAREIAIADLTHLADDKNMIFIQPIDS